MKKQFFWLALGVSTLCACTETDVIEESSVQSNAIGFENVIRKTTRAEVTGDLDQDGFDLFSVYCYYTKNDDLGNEMAPVKLFDNQTVTKTADGWTYEGTRYWMPGTKYNFYAYSCADVALQSDDKGIPSFEVPTTVTEATKLDERGLKINNYVCDATHQHDLIVAAVEGIDGKNENNDKVHFSFRHALCKVSAEFVNDFPQGYTVTVSDVKLCNFYNKASLNVRSLKDALILPTDPTDAQMKALQDGVWNNQTRFTTEGATETEIAMPIKDNKTDALFMIPVYYDNANLRLEFTITVAQGDDVFLTRKLRGTWKPVWIPGRAYKYEIHINGDNAQLEPIVFETSQDITGNESWGADITTSITFGIAD